MANEQWYYTQTGAKAGPVAGSALKRLAVAGSLKPTDMVWREGMQEWTPASRVKGLFPEAAMSTVPPPVPPSVNAVADAPETNFDERYNSLYRSSDEKVFLGLARGVSHKFGLPTYAVRVVFAIAMWFLLPFILYFIGGLFVPKLPTKNVARPA